MGPPLKEERKPQLGSDASAPHKRRWKGVEEIRNHLEGRMGNLWCGVGFVGFRIVGEDLPAFTSSCVFFTWACLRAFVIFSAGLAAVPPFLLTDTLV
jgi:hypothetical protein